MLAYTFLIPIVFAVFLLIFFRKKTVWWEYLILILPSIGISTAIYFGMISYSENDTEYLGDYVVSIRYYEPWDEYVHQTCTSTSTDADGNVTTTTYDCSYVDDHSEKWSQVTSTGCENEITQKEYNRIYRMWNTSNVFVDMHRDYHSYDGDMYEKRYDNKWEHSKTLTTTNSYKNKVRASRSIFGFSTIKPEEAKKLGLYDYPELYKQSNNFWESDNNQNPILGFKPTKNQLNKFQYINGYYGPHKQFRVFVLFFYNKSHSIVEDQKSYWDGGNKNEMIICIGLDSISKQIQWADAFSWCDRPTFEVKFRSFMQGKKKLNLDEIAKFTEYGAAHYWSRKNFNDFEYLNVELSHTQLKWLLIIIFIFNLGMSIFIVLNDFEYDDDGNENSNYNRSYYY